MLEKIRNHFIVSNIMTHQYAFLREKIKAIGYYASRFYRLFLFKDQDHESITFFGFLEFFSDIEAL